ncbi:TatD family hydrolase [Crocinitomix algicola]|uniref:TatD family hydrolase n=1 Tax=Crocinitomix algicola TaxID=1740263 RepID=UPI000872D7FA|nr:TatD family hydrolase [Crocinitomix algicola]
MIFIDTHTHLYSDQFDEDRDEVVNRAIESGVQKFFLPNIDSNSVHGMHKLVDEYPENCFPMMGLHPCSVNENWKSQLDELKPWLSKRKYIAIGEIGIDLYWDKTTLKYQKAAFAEQIKWAKEMKLPIAIHVRDAFNETFEVLDELNDDNLNGVFHCFTGTLEQAKKIINYGGFKLGVGGVLTFKNSGLDQTIKEIDLSHLILETDSPYLAPTPKRGKRNESDYTTLIASKLAEVKSCSIEDIADSTTKNALELFDTVK